MACKYCSSNSLVGNKAFIEAPVCFGILGNMILSEYIAKYDDATFLNISLDTYGIGANQIRRVQKIKYCPVCGDKLN